ncbi:Aspartate--tRNA ligase [Sphingobacterium daejeonense]|nr:Aspartate--tRNA ligase [Sphingobacterium daejeonense]
MILILSGPANKTRAQLSALRMELGNRMGLRKPDEFAPLWVIDFPLLEWDEETERFHAMHHPFTSPKIEDMPLLDSDPGKVRANAYDLVLNGNEIGGGSIRIHDKRYASIDVQASWIYTRTSSGPIWFLDERFPIWSSSTWWFGIRT